MVCLNHLITKTLGKQSEFSNHLPSLISVFFDFRVYKGSVNTEIKEHGFIICRFEAQLR